MKLFCLLYVAMFCGCIGGLVSRFPEEKVVADDHTLLQLEKASLIAMLSLDAQDILRHDVILVRARNDSFSELLTACEFPEKMRHIGTDTELRALKLDERNRGRMEFRGKGAVLVEVNPIKVLKDEEFVYVDGSTSVPYGARVSVSWRISRVAGKTYCFYLAREGDSWQVVFEKLLRVF